MADLNIRLRYPGGSKTISVSSQANFNELKHLIFSVTGIVPDCQIIKSGYPPKVLENVDEASLQHLGILSGETLIIEGLSQPQEPKPKQIENPTRSDTNEKRQSPDKNGNIMLRRIIAADNSCLFNSVGYAMEGRQKNAGEYLRDIIGVFVESDPVNFDEAMLGRPPTEYRDWIKLQTSWGGAIELAILSNYYQVEIAAVSVQSVRLDIFGQDSNYGNRIYVIYDGIHYDVLARNRNDDAPEAQDQTIFDKNDEDALQGALFIANDLKMRRQFTDVSNFDLMCGVCNTGLRGEKDALEHFKITGHTNFQEIHK